MSDSHPHVFTIAGTRETIDQSRAQQLVQPLHDAVNNKQTDRYTKLVLTNKSFTVDAARVFADAIAQLDGITHCDYSDIIAGQSTDNAVAVLSTITGCLDKHKLIEFNISDNALGQKGVVAVAAALRNQPQLQHLYFNNNGLQGDAVNEIAILLVGDKDNTSNTQLHNLHTFEIFNNLLTDAGGVALSTILQSASQLRSLKIQTNRISEKGGTAIMNALQHHKHFNTLILSDNSFGSAAGQVALNLVVQNRHLQVLNLSDIGFEKEHVLGIVKQLSNSRVAPQLHELQLSHSELTQRNVPLLIDALQSKQHLHTLVLEGNELHSAGCSALLDALQKHNSLKHINLNENQIGDAAAKSIIAFIQKSKSLHTLSLKGNLLTEKSVESIQAAIDEIGNNKLVVELDDQEEDEEDLDVASDDDDVAEPDVELDDKAEEQDTEIEALADKVQAATI